MTWCYAIFAAILQGLTEFLPVSSSGHILLLSRLFGIRPSDAVAYTIVLHLGSLIAIVVFYFRLLIGFFRKDQLNLLFMVLIGSIPAGVAGMAIKYFNVDDLLGRDMTALGICFLITATMLRMTTSKTLVSNEHAPVGIREITISRALVVGLFQMVAILPGISRSGATITGGMLCGIDRKSATAYSFLLALVAIGGATCLELIDTFRYGEIVSGAVSGVQLAVALAVSAAVSLGSLVLLSRLVEKGGFHHFSWYLYALAVLAIAIGCREL